MSAMQQMLNNMMKDMLLNLPPDVKEKLQQGAEFIAMVDGRLARIQNDLELIKSHLGIHDRKAIAHGGRTDVHESTGPQSIQS